MKPLVVGEVIGEHSKAEGHSASRKSRDAVWDELAKEGGREGTGTRRWLRCSRLHHVPQAGARPSLEGRGRTELTSIPTFSPLSPSYSPHAQHDQDLHYEWAHRKGKSSFHHDLRPLMRMLPLRCSPPTRTSGTVPRTTRLYIAHAVHCRYMGLNDLLVAIKEDPNTFLGDEPTENKVLRQVLALVEDKISEVKNQAVKWCVLLTSASMS